jgi:single-strand DNA-binding protein
MAKSYNKVIIMGNLTRDPEIRETPSGQNVVSFSLALNRSYKDGQDQWQETTDFIDVTAWGRLADQVSQRLNKGNRAMVDGRLQSREWEKDGVKRTKVEVLATDVTFLDVNYNTQDDGMLTPEEEDAIV